METRDIFTSITRYDKAEDRFTASLVYLLNYLWNESKGNEARRRRAYCNFLKDLCGKTLPWGEQIFYKIQAYEPSDEGKKRTLDFEIISAIFLAILEKPKASTSPLSLAN